MGYEVDYAEAKKKVCSSKLTIENRVFYVKLFESPAEKTRYFAGDQKGIIVKEISESEFFFWLETLAEKVSDVENIKRQLGSGKKYPQ
ncbi:MAG TPA: hypothetical protein VJL33_01600 [Candidatus Bathyarchaeia archaeon]|nr:hypothetical protein [Candidatus Bathyarchaeia archaeon]